MYDYNYGYDYGSVYNDYGTTSSILGGMAVVFGIIMIISLAIGIVSLISQWKIYKKAGKGGWECLVPIYNIIVLLEIVELPMWYIALFFVPIANIYAMFKIYIELAHKFGKSTGFGVATAFFNFVCLPILAFGKDNVYKGGNTTTNPTNTVSNIQNNNPIMFGNVQNVESNSMNNTNDNNFQQPIMFNQNINTEINPIQPATPVENNIINNSTQNNNQQETITSVSTPEVQQPVQFGPMQQPANPEQTQTLNVIPNVPVQTVEENKNNNEINLVQPTAPVENNIISNPQPENIQMPQPNPAPEAQQPITFGPTQQPANPEQAQILNVIPNMGTMQQSQMQDQNTGNNQNM